MEVDFFLFRHGQTDWNLEQRCQGSTDIPLNHTGIEQAKGLAEFMKDIHLDVVFSSHLKRAHETAKIITESKKIPLIVEKDLRETFFGEMEGKFMTDIVSHVGEDFWNSFRDFENTDPNLSLPGGETRGSVVERMSGVLDKIILEGQYKSVGISTHGSALVNLLRLFWDRSQGFPYIGNCSLFHLKYNRESGFKEVTLLNQD
ncbi:MAG: histidine phosphatase family protein [Deltaproteobacteria bacterium]|nr:MAG: histidine phosphatase family protein [Deltaproteobacteria bacterium]TNF31081.1 MAG: histidine phosphatase family protein [Deltaproteobacteria bacterium]